MTIEGLKKIVSIKASMGKGLSELVGQATPFVGLTPEDRPLVELPSSIDPYWFVGFADAESCFFINIKAGIKATYIVSLVFSLCQHSRDSSLFDRFSELLGCGKKYEESKKPVVRFRLENFPNIVRVLIPFFIKYPLLSAKRLDFEDFCRAAALINNKGHHLKA